MLSRLVTCIILAVSFLPASALLRMSRDQVLDTLDRYLTEQSVYDARARQRVQAKVRRLSTLTGTARQQLQEDIISDYMHINVDSALLQLARAEAAATDSAARMRLRFMRLEAYPIKGMLHTSLLEFEKIDPATLPESVKPVYFRCASQVNDYARDMYDQPQYKRNFINVSRMMMDSLMNHVPRDSFMYRYYKASSRIISPEGAEAVAEMTVMLDSLSRDERIYARIAGEIGNYYATNHRNTERAEFYYALSAISDILTGNNEATSLHRLGKLLYDRGDVERAMRYLTVSLQRSVSSGVRIRALEIAEALPLVIDANRLHDASQRSRLEMLLAIIGIVAVLLIVAVVVLWRQRMKLGRMRRMLSKRHQEKDRYIRQLLSLCAAYLQAMTDMNRLTTRKLKAKQYQDLLEQLESGKMVRSQLQAFNTIFDDAFLKNYPDFIPGVNRLLQPDKRFVEADYENGMNTELRLLAFIWLGVDDSQEIAKFLGLSVNSVYTYRNRLKSRALSKDTFEADLRRHSAAAL